MNLSVWPYTFYQNCSYNQQSMLNSSSGYESANTDTSFLESNVSSPILFARIEPSNLMNEDSMEEENHHHQSKKRRLLSSVQRQEANRRERQRMDIINHAYEQLRNVLPFKKGRKRQKMSRMDTVEGAIQYIESLLKLLDASNHCHNSVKS